MQGGKENDALFKLRAAFVRETAYVYCTLIALPQPPKARRPQFNYYRYLADWGLMFEVLGLFWIILCIYCMASIQIEIVYVQG